MNSEETKNKLIEKMKQKALEWQSSEKKEPAVETFEETNQSSLELRLITELKKIIADSSLERKVIFLTVLNEQEKKITEDGESMKLPEVVRNLTRKEEIKSQVTELTKKYSLNGKTLCYLWGIENGK